MRCVRLEIIGIMNSEEHGHVADSVTLGDMRWHSVALVTLPNFRHSSVLCLPSCICLPFGTAQCIHTSAPKSPLLESLSYNPLVKGTKSISLLTVLPTDTPSSVSLTRPLI